MNFSEGQKIDICVKVLEDFLHKCSEETRKKHLSALRREREGWVEDQLTQWAAKEIQKRYHFDIWEITFYFAIDVWVELDAKFSSH